MVATDRVRSLFPDARALLRLSALDPPFEILQGQYHTKSGLLHVNCEPEQEVAGLIRATSLYIDLVERLSAER